MEQLQHVADFIKKNKKDGKTVSLATGNYDILSVDHIRFLEFMKQNSDVVVIGLENDASIKLNFGSDRPLNPFYMRAEILQALKAVSMVFEVPFVYSFSDPQTNEKYEELTAFLNPDFIATNSLTSRFLNEKQERAKKLGIKLLAYSKTSLLSG